MDINDIGADNPNWALLAEDSSEVSNGVLASFDSTALRNDGYVIRVLAQDFSGNIGIQAHTVFVAGEAKLGQFALEYKDLSLPLAGIPIEITRRYDSFDTDVQGDFGFGWSLKIGNPYLRETLPVAANEESVGLFVAEAYSAGTRVYLTNPDGVRIGFSFEPVADVSLLGTFFHPVFAADPGVYDRLEVDDISISQRADGSFSLFLLGFNYNPEDFRLIRPDGTVYHYNQFIGLQRVGVPNGSELTVTDAGIFHSSGSAIAFARDNEGRITRITDPDGNPISYAYDADGNLAGITYQDSSTLSYRYLQQPAHYLDQIIDSQGRLSARYEYDEKGRIVATTDADGNRIESFWDPANFRGTLTDADGNVTEYVYDANGNVLQQTDPLGGVITQTFDADNNRTSETDKNGNHTTFSYDAAGNPVTIVNPLGDVYTYSYDPLGNISGFTDPLGRTLVLNQDASGNLTKITTISDDTLLMAYDSQGRLTSFIDSNGDERRYEYDNDLVNPSRVINPHGTIQQFEYDWSGQVTRFIDESGAERHFTYDSRGQLIADQDALGNVTRFDYAGKLLIRAVDAQGNETDYEYDDLDRLVSLTDPLAGTVTFGYDANGNRTSVTDPGGNTTRFAYDALGRLVQRIDPLGNASSFTYDAVGNLIQAIDRNGRTRAFSYDGLNRPVTETWLDGGVPINEISTLYDVAGRLQAVADDHSVIDYTHDATDRVLSTDITGTPGLPPVVLSYGYDAVGNRTQISDNAGVSLTSVYDGSGRLTSHLWQGVGHDPVQIDFSYDAVGDPSTINRFAGIGGLSLLASTGFSYDALGRLTHLDHLDNVNTTLADYIYSYDSLGRLTSQSHHGETVSYTYDALSQLLSADSTLYGAESFIYDANGNRISGTHITGPANRLLSDGAFDYDYDNEGNTVRKTDTATGDFTDYEYDYRNRLVRVASRAADITLLSETGYTYDALDRRILTTTNGATTATVYDGDNAWGDFDVFGNPGTRYLYGDSVDQLFARNAAGGPTDWYLTDRLGTVRDIAGPSGTVIDHLDYSGFGAVLAHTDPGQGDRFRFTGREYSEATGQYYYRARFYDPLIGRFINEDPIGFESGDYNLYRYVGNSPQNRTDPSGKSPAVEYATLLCEIVLPLKDAVEPLAECVKELYEGINEAYVSATSNNKLTLEFYTCLGLDPASMLEKVLPDPLKDAQDKIFVAALGSSAGGAAGAAAGGGGAGAIAQAAFCGAL